MGSSADEESVPGIALPGVIQVESSAGSSADERTRQKATAGQRRQDNRTLSMPAFHIKKVRRQARLTSKQTSESGDGASSGFGSGTGEETFDSEGVTQPKRVANIAKRRYSEADARHSSKRKQDGPSYVSHTASMRTNLKWTALEHSTRTSRTFLGVGTEGEFISPRHIRMSSQDSSKLVMRTSGNFSSGQFMTATHSMNIPELRPHMQVVLPPPQVQRRPSSYEEAGYDQCLARIANHRANVDRSKRALLSLTEDDYRRFRLAIQSNVLCSMLNDRELLQLAQSVHLLEFDAGEDIIREGEPATHLFVVMRGECSSTAVEGFTCSLGPGECFGEVELVHATLHRRTIRADGPGCTLWGVPYESFRSSNWACAHRMFMENVRLVGRCKVLEFLHERQLLELCQRLPVLIYTAGMDVVTEGSIGDSMFIVKSGSLDVKVDGKKIQTLGSGDHFGEQSILQSEPRSSTVTATTRCMCVALRRNLLESVLGGNFAHTVFFNVMLSAFKKTDVFSEFPMYHLRCLVEATMVKDYPPRSKVLEDSDAQGLRFLIVLSGELKIKAQGEHRSEVYSSGQWFGEEYVIDLSRPFTHTLQNESDTPCKLALLSADGLKTLTGNEKAEEKLNQRQRMALLRKVYVFRHLSNYHCKLLAKSFRTISTKAKDDVVTEGSMGNAFFVIQTGEFLVTIAGRTIRTLGKGDYFGERALLYDEPRSATVTCLSSEAVMMKIEKTVFMQILEEKMLRHLDERIRLQSMTVTLEQLKVVSNMGCGAFSVVKAVEHKSTGTRYALKCISREAALKNRYEEALLREREILLENDHPFIVKVVRTFRDTRYLYFLTELVTGGELYSAIRKIGLLSKAQAQFYVGSLILALESLHERYIVYRDLKPENVLLDHQGYLRLIDFGCAIKLRGSQPTRNRSKTPASPQLPPAAAGRSTQRTAASAASAGVTFTLTGTPHYMAPEVILGEGYGLSCDNWSLGVCLYEFVCGPLPFGHDFDSDNAVDIFRATLTQRLHFPGHIDDAPGAKDLTKKLLRRTIDTRIGCGPSGWSDVRKHSFFRHFSWDNLVSRQLTPPLVPEAEPEASGQNEDDLVLPTQAAEVAMAEDDWDRDF
mmetsp:Transcript_72481/g.172790  ORF Transcript_72481/g.172790 Transcript_72481/m.172790 type:complete len:1107 (+) Transcript_72481:102-3422(+)